MNCCRRWCCCWPRSRRFSRRSCGRSLGGEGAVLRAALAESDPALAREDEIEIPVQINGKLVSVVRVPLDADSAAVEVAAVSDEKVKARIAGKTIMKVIVVPRKTVNLVVRVG